MKTAFLLFSMGFATFFKSSNTENACILVALDKMDIVYIGIDNPFSVNVKDMNQAKVSVSVSGGGTITPTGVAGHYNFKPDGSVRQPDIQVSVIQDDGSKKLAYEMHLRARKIPHPEVLIGTRNGGTITVDELKAITQINAGLGEGFPIEGQRFTINGYTMVVTHQDGATYIEKVNGNHISERIREDWASVKPGDYITACQIDATSPAGKLGLGGTTLEVK